MGYGTKRRDKDDSKVLGLHNKNGCIPFAETESYRKKLLKARGKLAPAQFQNVEFEIDSQVEM